MAFFKLLLKLFKRKQSKDAKKKKDKKNKQQQQFVAVQQPVPIQQSIQGGKVTYVQPVHHQQQQQYVQVPVVQQQQQYVQVPVQQQQQAFNPQAAANKVMAQQMAGYANGMTGNKIPQKYVNQGAAYAAGYMGKQKAPAQAQAGGYYAVAA
ncbi:hypothetical protein QC762_511118 [Podospora pseudocomata]|uniref:Uncharacterized protein n=2 Tax=Podospora TaxID=5144 RepID=A0ABR0GDQ1_9PEZI|nr:hypothetical protein QC761_511118 [Podospora bellae-mahoneyi]KAK4653870.1 hypothetical protein QC762_511118 [Podospora pseudocomata]